MLFDDTYKTIARPAEGLFKDKGSKFLAYAYPVGNEEEMKVHCAHLKKEHFSARHHCYAFRLGADKTAFRVNDDGEPSNTAGKPILGQIQSNDLTNIGIVVVRYFGGTLLGVSGLINAYKSAAADAIAHAEIITKTVNEMYELNFGHLVLNVVMKIIKDEKLEIIEQHFDLNCRILYSVRKGSADKIAHDFKKIDTAILKYVKTL